MKISIIIRNHTIKNADGTSRSFFGATAKGKYLCPKEQQDDPDGVVTNLRLDDLETSFIIKIAQKCAVMLPQAEGVYDLEFEGEAWKDTRPETKRPTIRLSGTGFKFTKTHELKPFEAKPANPDMFFDDVK